MRGLYRHALYDAGLFFLGPCSRFAMVITGDLLRMITMNFGLAILAASGGSTTLRLHTTLIRMVQRWRDTCFILANFRSVGLCKLLGSIEF